MEASILNTIKKMILGEDSIDITDFDTELIMLINASFSALHQMGVGDTPFTISGKEETWDSVLVNEAYLETIKRYIYIDVALVFDPPSSSIVVDTFKDLKKEDAWRIASEIDMVNKET